MDSAAQLELEALEYVKPIEKATERGDSNIQSFYRDATLFITGGTGFIGKQLIEKLFSFMLCKDILVRAAAHRATSVFTTIMYLAKDFQPGRIFRSCEIKKAFILIRPKKGVPTKERLEVMLNDPVFETVRKKKPDLKSRIICVEGDVAELRLGISDTDWDMIVDEVDIIFHEAATIRFDEIIRTAALVNIRGTREALKLAKACQKLRSYVHVSTAYCHATLQHCGQEVLEQFHQSPVPPETMMLLAETVDNDILNNITSSLISDWPNTYTFTKAIAEELVRSEVGNLPICIVRPTIVLQTYREPVPGWLDQSCMYGPSGIVLGVALGVIRALYLDNKRKVSIVPVDYVNNATIAAGWETGVRKTSDVPKIYHISSTNCGVTFRHVTVPMRGPKIRGIVSPLAIWFCYLIETNNRFIFWILSWLLHYIPAYIVDGVIKVLKLKKPEGLKSFVDVYSKFDKISSVFQFFLTNEWHFEDKNLKSLWQKMSDTDRKIYNFEMETIDWDHNSFVWCLGIRKYVIKDGLKGTVKARARQKWFKLANTAVLMIYLYVFWKILNWMWLAFRLIYYCF